MMRTMKRVFLHGCSLESYVQHKGAVWGSLQSMLDTWNKLEESSKTGQGKKSLISTFACFLTATAKV